ncbi:hypothetical protein WISP_95661 [Willisornis vidua]|uniref:Uncharacterized protein n=1 Tax=Willisornis vidua TaxID=1566151 RepID=A0ABQ9D5A3_9PASS|nr:hypothetical protein WISP_95661 [Willisornis vidua]
MNKGFGVLVDENLDVSQQCALAARKAWAASKAAEPAGQEEGGDSAHPLHSHDTPSGVLHPIWGLKQKKGMDLLEQVQNHALGLIELHEVLVGPLLKFVQVPLEGNPSFCFVNCTTQLYVICKLGEDALNPTVFVIDEDTKKRWFQDRA